MSVQEQLAGVASCFVHHDKVTDWSLDTMNNYELISSELFKMDEQDFTAPLQGQTCSATTQNICQAHPSPRGTP